ncbi:MAG: alpha-galactosidase [Bacilli bacterium]|nr:alpha-galactosidase [Bacilli bacterium]
MLFTLKYCLSDNPNVKLSSSSDNDDFSYEVITEKNWLLVKVTAKKDIDLWKAKIDKYLNINKNDLFLTNGYQSWTDTKERSLNEKEKNIARIPKLIVNKFKIDKYGDGYFYRYAKRRLHGYDLFYIKGKTPFFSFNNNYKLAYLIYEVDKRNKVLNLISDVRGLSIKAGESLVLFDLKVFDSYEKGIEEFQKKFNVEGKKIFGYTSWYNYYQDINEEIILRDLEALDGRFDLFQIDDGYETFVGDWLDVDPKKFPHGLEPIVKKIHDKGLKAGIWLAPFAAEEKSRLYREHPDWIKRDLHGKPVYCGGNWSGFFALDLDKKEVVDYIKTFLTKYIEYGFDFFKLDFLYSSAVTPVKGKTRAMLSEESYQLLRDCLRDKLILGCGAIPFSCYQKFEYLRVGPDVSLMFDDVWYMKYLHRERPSTKLTLQNTIYRSLFNHHLFLNDPDVFLLRKDNIKLTEEQKDALLTINALFGSVLMTSDDIGTYDEATKEHLGNKLALFKDAKDVGFDKEDDNIRIHYTLDDKKHELVYLTKKGVLNYEL